MFVPPRVLARSFAAKDKNVERQALTLLGEFMREDPTLYASRNQETDECVIEGMKKIADVTSKRGLDREMRNQITTALLNLTGNGLTWFPADLEKVWVDATRRLDGRGDTLRQPESTVSSEAVRR
jgi:hypothetical protein